jgi:branched-chain amino acid transport system substrate-binding protein
MRAIRGGLVLTFVCLTAAIVAIGQGGAKTNSASAAAVKIGISLPLTGRFAEPGGEAKNGYNIWAALVNKSKKKLLGRRVQLIIRDDASDQNTIVSDYNRLISQDRVDLLLGTFSSFLNLPASSVAERNRMVFVAPAGGSPALFDRKYHYYFFSQQATAPHQGDRFSAWVKSLKKSKRPKSAAYPTLNDPFTKPVIDGIQAKLEALGIRTVYSKVYPTDTTDFDTIAAQIKGSGADIVVHGAVFEDGVGLVRSMIKLGYNPKGVFQTTAPTEAADYSKAVGRKNTAGIFTAISYAPNAKGKRFPLNKQFVAAYKRAHGGQVPTEDAADAFAAAQVLQGAVKAVGKIDQDKMADWLHRHTVRTVLGPLLWNNYGAPRGAFFLAQWQKGKARILAPRYIRTAKKVVYPKPRWR